MRFLLFFSVWSAVLGLAFWYVSRRLTNRPFVSPKARRRARLLTLLLFLLTPLPMIFLVQGIESDGVDGLAWAGFVIMGLFSLVFTGILLRDLLLLPGWLARRLRGKRTDGNADKGPPDTSRREFLVHTTNMGILTGAGVLAAYGFTEARRRPVVNAMTVPIRGLPPAFEGFRIVQFSDLHVSPTIKRDTVEEVVEIVQGLKGDMIAFTGDLVDGSVARLRWDVEPLGRLSAPHGAYFVTGNHEYYSGAHAWEGHARELGFDVLTNEHRSLSRGGASIVLGGVTDYTAGDFVPEDASDPARAFRGAPADAPRILLAHQPRSIDAAVEAGVHLQLSGHTHGGQFFPWDAITRLGQPYLSGLHLHRGTWIHVNVGCAYWGPPLRLGVPPEISLITLTRGV